MLDHVAVPVSDIAAGRHLCTAALAPLGIGVVLEVAAGETGGRAHVGFRDDRQPFFWIAEGYGKPDARLHVAFAAHARADVDAFHAGLRPHCHANDHGAFVLDPDGHNSEAVCHHRAEA